MCGRKTIWVRAADGLFAGGAAFGVNTVIAIIQVPVLLHLWGDVIFGAWTALMAAASLVTILDIGHQNYVGNKLCALWTGPRDVLKTELGSALRIAACLGMLEVFVGCGIGLVMSFSSAWGTEQGAALKATIAYLVYWAVFGSVGGVLVRLYPPAGLYAWGQWLGVASRVAAFLGVLVVAYLGGGIVGAMWGQIACGVLFNLLLLVDLRRRFGDLFWPWKHGQWERGWGNFKNSLALSLGALAEHAGGNGLILLLGSALGPSQLVKFSTLRTLTNTGIQASTIVMSPVVPDLIRYRTQRSGRKVADLLSATFGLGAVCYSAGLVLSLLFVEELYEGWTRNQIGFEPLLFLLIALAVGVRIWASPLLAYIAGQNLVGAQSAVTFCRVGATLGLSLFLLPLVGLISVAIALMCGELLGAAIAVRMTRIDLIEFPENEFWNVARIGAFQLGFAALAWAGAILLPDGKVICCALGLVLVLSLVPRQWGQLPPALRLRIRDLVRK